MATFCHLSYIHSCKYLYRYGERMFDGNRCEETKAKEKAFRTFTCTKMFACEFSKKERIEYNNIVRLKFYNLKLSRRAKIPNNLDILLNIE